MKKADFAMIILIIFVSGLVSYFVASSFFGDFSSGPAKVKTIVKISPDIIEPNPEIFNKDAINPAVQVQIVSNDPNTSNTGTQ